jgi:L-threonylcarbamoyladenylate synthase
VIRSPTSETLASAADILLAGGLVAFPTETVYGLGADAANPDAVAKIYTVKRRPAEHPVIVHVQDAAAAQRWSRAMPEDARRLAIAFWPGPLTLIVPRADHVSAVVTGGQESVGLRVPSHPVAQALLAAFARCGGTGIAAPSANRFGRISPTTAQHVADDLAEDVEMIIDGGACAVGLESTIVACTGATPVLLRPGSIGIEAIARVLGRVPDLAAIDAPRASGTLASHYAPRTRTRLVPGCDLAAVNATREHGAPRAVLARTQAPPPHFRGTWIVAGTDPAAYAQALYANLRKLDAAGADEILVESVPAGPEWDAVRDRLQRAAS